MIQKLRGLLSSKPLFTKLITLYSALIVGILVISASFFYLYCRSVMVEKSVSYTYQILEQTQKSIESNLHSVSQMSMLLLYDSAVQTFLYREDYTPSLELRELEKSIEKTAVDFMFARQDILSMAIYNNEGYFVGVEKPVGLGEHFQEVYDAALAMNGQMKWMFHEEYPNSVIAARIIYDMSIRPVGLLVIDYDKNAINKIFESRLAESNGSFYIIDENGIILSSSNTQRINAPFEPNVNTLYPLGNKKYPYAEIDGNHSAVMMFDSEYNNWVYLCAIPRRALSVDSRTLVTFSLLMLALCCLVSVLIATAIARGVSKPINQLTDAVQNVDIQDLHFAQYTGADEFSYLFQSFNEMMDKLRQLIADNYEQKILQNQIELKMLHMQISPHFLYNTLDCICGLAVKNNDYEVDKTVKALADMMRYSISGDQGNLATIADEVKHVENYCAIQKVRMGDKLEYYIDIDDTMLDQLIPRISLQPFVENCIRHGTRENPEKTLVIEIAGYTQHGQSIISVADNGTGISQEAVDTLMEQINSLNFDKIHGIALPNINERIRRSFGDSYGITVKPGMNDGTIFTITLPCNRKGS